jgi:hypothetical protein
VVILLVEAVTFADNAAHVAKKVVSGDSDLPRDFNPLKPISEQHGPFAGRFKPLSRSVIEMSFTRLVDNFMTYFSEVLRECLQQQPAVLKSDRQVSFETILNYASIEDLKGYLVDRTIDELAYAGFQALSDWVTKKPGVPQLKTLPAREALIEFIEDRNCIIHNRCAASSKYIRIRKLPATAAEQPLSIDFTSLILVARATWECVMMIDPLLGEKFGLEMTPPTSNH